MGAAAGSRSPLPSRRIPISRRISASPSTLFSRMTDRASFEVFGSSRDSAAVEWIAMADRWLATMSCNSRAIRARSATTAWVRSISASSAVCSARSRAASATSRWLRTIQPVMAGISATRPTTTPISRASGTCHTATGTTVPTTVSSPVIQGTRRAVAGGPYTTAAYTRSVNITRVTRLPWVRVSAVSAPVPTIRAVRGQVRRSASQPAVTASGSRMGQRPSKSTIGSSAGRVARPTPHSSSPPSSPASAAHTSKRWGRGSRTAMSPSNTATTFPA
ncbi:hypothetical protein SAURM35S_00517 [Streptomyces aurantiogriseus]